MSLVVLIEEASETEEATQAPVKSHRKDTEKTLKGPKLLRFKTRPVSNLSSEQVGCFCFLSGPAIFGQLINHGIKMAVEIERKDNHIDSTLSDLEEGMESKG